MVESFAYYQLSGVRLEISKINLEKLRGEMTSEQVTMGVQRSTELKKEIEARMAAKKAGA